MAKLKNKPIPKVIHLIWIGGPMRDSGTDYLTRWKSVNRNYHVWLWYDSMQMTAYAIGKAVRDATPVNWNQSGQIVRDDNRDVRQLAEAKAAWASADQRGQNFNDLTGKNERELARDNLQKLTSQVPANVKLKDVRAILEQLDNVAFYELELVNRGGNFGAASDILRYELLRRFGGIYSDVDLMPLTAFEDFLCDGDLARLGRVMQGQSGFSNALLASHADSQFFGRVSAKIAQNYKLLGRGKAAKVRSPTGNEMDLTLDQYYDDYRASTIYLTGPSVVTQIAYLMAQETLAERHRDWVNSRHFFQSKDGYRDPDYVNANNFLDEEILFDPRYVDFDTEEGKDHKWLEKPPAK